MSLDLYRILAGLNIESEDTATNASVLVGTGAPGGDTSFQDAAVKGSLYLRTDAASNDLQLYYKVGNANSAADWRQVVDKTYVDALVNGLTWRPPVVVLDATSYANSSAFPTGGTVDGVALSANDRVLFTNVTAGAHENVWHWSPGVSGAVTGTVTTGAGGSFQISGDYTSTFVAGTVFSIAGSTGNDGDFTVASSSFGAGVTTIVVTGTVADNTADGTLTALWVEDTNAESPGDAVLVIDGTSADTQWVYSGVTNGWVMMASTANTTEFGFIRTFIGKNAAGSEMPTYTSAVVVTQNVSLEAAIGQLDAAIGDRTYTEQNYVTNGQTVTASINALDVALGAIGDQFLETTATNVNAAGTVTVDSVPVADATEIKWIIQVRANGTPANRRAIEIHAFNDGASAADFNQASILKLGSSIAGFALNVDVSGGNMRLRLTATPAVDYVVKRLGYSAF